MHTIATKTKTVQHMIVRDRRHYFYNRFENGRQTVNAELISAGRAEQIYDAHPTQTQSGHVSFAADALPWSWTSAPVTEEVS